MTRIRHYGIHLDPNDDHSIGTRLTDPDPKGSPRDLPEGFISDGDSFIAWGEFHDPDGEPSDLTLHVLTSPTGSIELQRLMLADFLRPTERLFDYVVETDAEDWSEDSVVVIPSEDWRFTIVTRQEA